MEPTDHGRLVNAVREVQNLRATFAPARESAAGVLELRFAVVDVHKLPTSLVIVTPDEAAIRAQFCTGWCEGQPIPAVDGIRFTVARKR